MTRYRTSLYDDSGNPEARDFRGRTFTLCLHPTVISSAEYVRRLDSGEHNPSTIDFDGNLYVLSPELIIEASSPERAKYAANLVTAAFIVSNGCPEFETLEPDPEHPYIDCGYLEAGGVPSAATIAVKAARRRNATYALIRLCQSFRCVGIRWIDLHPNYGRLFPVSGNPFEFTQLAQGILAAASAIEELGFKIPAGHGRDSKIKGEWNPPVLAELQSKLASIGIAPDYEVTWQVRGGRSRIKKKRPPPKGELLPWARYDCRDRSLNVAEAIHYAERLRSKTSAHRFSDLTRSLSIFDAVNVQHLARDLLYHAIGYDPIKEFLSQERAEPKYGRPCSAITETS